MSRFVDPKATKRFVIGPCDCPGLPHDEDWAEVRSQLSGIELAEIARSSGAVRLKMLIVSWNLHDATGKTAPLDLEHLGMLYGDWFERFNEWTEEHIQLEAKLPNGSSAPSRNGSRARTSHIQTTRRKG